MADENSSYYPGGGDEAAPSEADAETPSGTEAPKPEGDEQEEKDEGVTALLPKSILAGKDFEPGEEVVLKVVHIYDDEIEVEYATGKGDDEGAETGDKGDSPTMKKSMASMGEY